MLMIRHTKNPTSHKAAVVPEVSLAFPRQVAKPTSNIPPIINKIQFIFSRKSLLNFSASRQPFINFKSMTNPNVMIMV